MFECSEEEEEEVDKINLQQIDKAQQQLAPQPNANTDVRMCVGSCVERIHKCGENKRKGKTPSERNQK